MIVFTLHKAKFLDKINGLNAVLTAVEGSFAHSFEHMICFNYVIVEHQISHTSITNTCLYSFSAKRLQFTGRSRRLRSQSRFLFFGNVSMMKFKPSLALGGSLCWAAAHCMTDNLFFYSSCSNATFDFSDKRKVSKTNNPEAFTHRLHSITKTNALLEALFSSRRISR